MSATPEAVEAAALQLNTGERLQLIERLIDSLLLEPALHADWNAEIARRLAELDAGLVKTIPAEAVFARLRARTARQDSES